MKPHLYRPTGLRLASKHCPAALSFFEAVTAYDRRPFEAGVAAHAVLQAIGEATKVRGPLDEKAMEQVSDATCRALIEFGRVEEGVKEPPLSADLVFEGRELALTYAVNFPLSQTAHYEIGLAVDAEWQAVQFDAPEARLRCILDVLDIEEAGDEESVYHALIVTDYKSAWPTDASELETIQRRAQALVAVAHFGTEFDVLRRRVVNLRNLKTFEDELHFAHGGLDVLDQWRRDLAGTMEALDAQAKLGRRPASPGAGCQGCPYLLRCDDAQRYIEDTRTPGTARQRAEQYCVAVGTMERLRELLREDTAESPIPVRNGLVGTVGKPKRVLTEDATTKLCDEWGIGESDGRARGFAKASRLTPTNADELAKVLFPGRANAKERERFMGEITTTVIDRKFGIHPLPKETRSDATTDAA